MLYCHVSDICTPIVTGTMQEDTTRSRQRKDWQSQEMKKCAEELVMIGD